MSANSHPPTPTPKFVRFQFLDLYQPSQIRLENYVVFILKLIIAETAYTTSYIYGQPQSN